MNRPIREEDLLAYVDDALDADARHRIETYLQQHPDVARRIAGYARQRTLLRTALGPVAQEPIPPELDVRRMLETRRLRRAWPWRAAAAVLLAFGLGGAGGWLLHGDAAQPASGIAALAREGASNYLVYAADRTRPVELGAADRADLLQWLSGRLRRPITLPDLSHVGYRYMGGRLVATEHGPAGLFMYDDDHGTRVVMLVRPMAREDDLPMQAHAQAGVAGYAWADRGLGYSMAAPDTARDLHPLADEMRRQLRRQG